MTNIKKLRLSHGDTQQQLATHLSITRGAYSNIENGKREPDISTLIQLADYFNVTIDYLVNHKEEPQMNTNNENNLLTSDQAFIANIANAFGIDADAFSKMISEMSAEDIQIFLTPSVHVPAESRYRLKRARFSAGLCQADLAKRLGVSDAEYREYESGEKHLSSETLDIIAKLLNVDSNWLHCDVKYIINSTQTTFDPGIYKRFVDSAFDPIDRKLDIFEVHTPIENLAQSPTFNMLLMYLKLDPADQGEIRGEIKAFLKSEKYSLQEELKHVWAIG